MAVNDLLKMYKAQGMDVRQLNQIQQGIDFGLSEKEIQLYAKPCFDELQMNSIRLAIKHRLTDEEIACVADSKYDGHQMEQLVTGLKDGLTLEKVKTYADEKLTAHEMCQKRINLIKESVADTPSIFSREYYDNMVRISEKQSQQLEKMNMNFSWMQEYLREHKIPYKEYESPEIKTLDEEVKKLKEREVKLQLENQSLQKALSDKEQLIFRLIKKNGQGVSSFFSGLIKKKQPKSIMELMGNTKFSEKQLEQIRLGYEHGLDLEEILNYAKPRCDPAHMECIRSVLEVSRKRRSDRNGILCG